MSPGTLVAAIRRILAVTWQESLFLLRDRTSRALLLGVPILQLLLFGTAVNLDVRGVTVAVAGAPSSLLRDSLVSDGRFRIIAEGVSEAEAERLLTAGQALVAILLPDPATAGAEHAAAGPRVIADAADPAAVRPALLGLRASLLESATVSGRLSGPPPVPIEWKYNPDGRTAWSILPGLAGAVVMIGMLMLGAMSLVRERELETWDSLLATPLRAGEILAGKALPYVLLGTAQSLLMVALGSALFAVPVRGSLPVLLLAAALTAASYLAVGLAISAMVRTQMQAMQSAVFLYLPSMLLSGFMFPFEGMPSWAQAIGEALPLTRFVRAARDILLRGADDRAWSETGILTVIACACGAAAAACIRLSVSQRIRRLPASSPAIVV